MNDAWEGVGSAYDALKNETESDEKEYVPRIRRKKKKKGRKKATAIQKRWGENKERVRGRPGKKTGKGTGSEEG